ncbi:MAG: HAD family hydrolase [Desulfatirhabdiaceae bacterium]
MKMNIRVVAFDCDGVMFDTKEVNREYYDQILRHFDKPEMTPDQLELAHMHMVEKVLSILFTDPEEFEAAMRYRLQMPYLPLLAKMKMEPELKPLLQSLRPDYKTAIATNRTNTIQEVLRVFDLKSDFDLVVSALDVPRAKPYPDILIRIVDHFDVAPHEIIYIGDSELDEAAAKGAGVPFVAYQNPALDARFHITSLKEVEQILK